MNDDWIARAKAELRGRSLDDLTWHTPEGIAVRPVYGPDDLADLPQTDAVPGEEPFTRGPNG